MTRVRTLAVAATGIAAVAANAGSSALAAADHGARRAQPAAAAAKTLKLHLTPSSSQLAACMPRAHIDVTVKETVDQIGFDSFSINARGLAPNRTFTVFLLQQADSPFGAAEYIGDFSSDAQGVARNTFRLIVSEAFSSTLVNGNRQRIELNRVGAWFADPADDEFCLPGSAATPFDGDNS